MAKTTDKHLEGKSPAEIFAAHNHNSVTPGNECKCDDCVAYLASKKTTA